MTDGPILTSDLALWPLEVADAHDMVNVLADPSLYEFTGGEPPTLDVLLERNRHQVAGSPDVGETWLNWTIRSADGGVALGFIQATVVGHRADLAWLVGVEHQGRGIATKAAAAAKDWLANTGVGRVEAHVHPDHLASQAVARRLGMSLTGEVDRDGEEVWASEPTPSWGKLD